MTSGVGLRMRKNFLRVGGWGGIFFFFFKNSQSFYYTHLGGVGNTVSRWQSAAAPVFLFVFRDSLLLPPPPKRSFRYFWIFPCGRGHCREKEKFTTIARDTRFGFSVTLEFIRTLIETYGTFRGSWSWRQQLMVMNQVKDKIKVE